MLGGCGGTAAPAPPPAPAAPVPTTVRPLRVGDGAPLVYVVRGPAGILDHPESGRQMPRPRHVALARDGAGALSCRIELDAAAEGQVPQVPVPPVIVAAADAIGMVWSPADVDRPHDHAQRPEAIAPRIYGLIATLLLMRPSLAAPAGAARWEDVGFLHASGPIGCRLAVQAQGTVPLGGVPCERFRWQLEGLLPDAWLGEARVVDAFGLTFYDPAAQQVVASEVMFRVVADASAWGFIPWSWLSCAREGVTYTGTEEDLTWVDGAFNVERQPEPPGWAGMVVENTAIKRLSGIVRGMRDFRQHARVDVDGDGQGEAGFLSELAGTSNLRTPGGLLGPKVPVVAGARYTEYGVFDFHGRCDARGRSRGEQYRWYCCLAGADGPLAQGERPPDGDPRHGDAQERPGGWAIWGWPDDDSPARLVLHVDDEGVARGTYDLAWRGADGGPPGPLLERPVEGVTWTTRSKDERLPQPEAKVLILAKDVDVAPEAYDLLGRQIGLRVRLRVPDAFASLPLEAGAEIRKREWLWLDAWRDRRVSAEELGPIVADVEAILQGQAPK
jgi:hypothetical protein